MVWTDEDRDIALAWQVEQAMTCDGCGHPIDESHDPANADRYEVHKERCHACTARSVVARSWAESEQELPGGGRPFGMKWRTNLEGVTDG